MGGLNQRMRDRWRTVSDLWENNRQASTQLDLRRQIDYLHKLTSQLEWQHNPGRRPIHVVQTEAGQPTAALLQNAGQIVDETLYWITCKDIQEANYLLSIINSQALYVAVTPLMPKGQFGARHLHKHLWKLPIPEYDPDQKLHVRISQAGERAASGAAARLEQLRQERGERLTVTIVRRELRAWLRSSPEGAAVEAAVGQLLAG